MSHSETNEEIETNRRIRNCKNLFGNLEDGVGGLESNLDEDFVSIRDKIHEKILSNMIKSNEIKIVVERRNLSLESIVQENIQRGNIRIPQNYDCTIQQIYQTLQSNNIVNL